MPRHLNQPPAPKERPVALSATGTPPLRAAERHSARLPAIPRFEGPQSTKATEAGHADMIAFWVFVGLVVLGLVASARALLLM